MDETVGFVKILLDEPDKKPFAVLKTITGIATQLLRKAKYFSDSACNHERPPHRSDSSATKVSNASFHEITSDSSAILPLSTKLRSPPKGEF